MHANPRSSVGQAVSGDILEIGPGSRPFIVAPGSRVRYADRSVEGGRDANWPELIGSEPGVQAHFDLDLDVDGLKPIPAGSLDGVIASHVIEHVANPLEVIREFGRVVHQGGRLLLVVPDRRQTFDAVRAPTPFEHVLAEFRTGVRSVDDDHIKEFCAAIYGQPPIHPPVVREWHNPDRLTDPAMLALHRRRSIHVHCWSPEEFASLIACFIAEGLGSWRLIDLYFSEDFPDGVSDEFALLLEAVTPRDHEEACRQFVNCWADRVIASERVAPQRLVRFHHALRRDLTGPARAAISDIPLTVLAARISVLKKPFVDPRLAELQERLSESESGRARAQEQADALEAQVVASGARVAALEKSTSWRVTAPMRAMTAWLLRR